ncbi:MAG: DUF4294 domain-containing protein [Bacteroidetes bacterium CG02_land_8_20_14_3_00_31_25]|nr:DUF4294 domain-containing protein [Bacteroidota bacterium]PIV59932.1 MAG: DUF4294 domain-containing protein [Bacteroidetes bacterium CG02_land_8_20_14_3_00_31_25]PIX32932.1 MAG: DUF4294 domain-containing protein [Bacteroidetes bacterium CG_4_8_14_3_um_filter_31_14]
MVGIRIAFSTLMQKKFTFIFFFLISDLLYAQEQVQQPINGFLVYTKVINGDTLPFINLREVIVLPPHEFHSKHELQKYAKLVKNIKKVLPYAKIVRTKLLIIQNELEKLPTESLKREYIKKVEKILKNDFQDEITNLTMTQGRILIKLIDRETGNTSYALIKELKGAFNAFLYQSIARLFGENLKDEYDPKGDDKLVEEIVIRIENGEY